jgi:hypothetical protein
MRDRTPVLTDLHEFAADATAPLRDGYLHSGALPLRGRLHALDDPERGGAGVGADGAAGLGELTDHYGPVPRYSGSLRTVATRKFPWKLTSARSNPLHSTI